MNKLILPMLGTSLAFFATSAPAATVISTLNFRNFQNVVSGVNLGGLRADAGTQTAANGDDLLNFQITIDDSADSGAVFTSIVTVTGTLGTGTGVVYLGPGIVNFQPGTSIVRQNTLTVSMGTPVQTSGPAATISFDGFSSAKFSQWTQGGGDAMSFDGTTYNATTGDGADITFNALAPSGSTFSVVANNFRQDEVRSQFTVTPVPEPSAALLGGLGLLGLLRRRR